MKYMKFAPELVPLVQNGTKTVTRRPIKPQQLQEFDYAIRLGECHNFFDIGHVPDMSKGYVSQLCPYGRIGDTIQSDAG
ncbi:MAG: hypothetical protein ACYTEX_26825, partial [Planctomycetota bacterium]